ncbi:hypothetical protein DB30_02847 [Enhygromyxa salina]|uniref:Uncharacterized protein n=1 Tax=Enhygromyxa salina TaxID=215803 RepID=A0A0C1ZK17_9BACT|nr:hypothetical protein DB30_02847 [Enhygromyxa salina]
MTSDALLGHHRRPDLLFEEVLVGDALLRWLGRAARKADAPEDEDEGPDGSKVTLSIPGHDL